jgi:hypothetical protein
MIGTIRPNNEVGPALLEQPGPWSTLSRRVDMVSVVEVWVTVKECEHYEVSNLGRVKSKPRTIVRKNGTNYRVRERILSEASTPTGYKFVSLYDHGTDRQHYVHSLVATAFIGDRPAGMQVNHRDGIKANNTPDNLEYVTGKQNIRHAVELGLLQVVGTLNPQAKYMPDQIRQAHALVESGLKHKEASAITGVDVGTIESVCGGKNWRCLGLPIVRRA